MIVTSGKCRRSSRRFRGQPTSLSRISQISSWTNDTRCDHRTYGFHPKGLTYLSQNYIELVTRMERVVKSATTDESAARLRKALVVVSAASTSFPPPPVLTRPLPYQLCEAVCVYKLIDVLYDLQEQESPSLDNPSYPKMRIKWYLPNEVKYSSDHLTTCSGLTPGIRTGLYMIGFNTCVPRR
jgi:hypothetical protein